MHVRVSIGRREQAPPPRAYRVSRLRGQRSSAAAVSGPTLPSTARPFASWKATTAASVCSPNVPSAAPGLYPAAVSASWRSVTTAGSFSPPSWSFVPSGSVNASPPPVDGSVVVGSVGRRLGRRGGGGRRRRLGLGRRGRRHRLGDGRRRLLAAPAEEHHRDRGDDPDDRHEHEPRDGAPPPEVGPAGGRARAGAGRSAGRSSSGTSSSREAGGTDRLPPVASSGAPQSSSEMSPSQSSTGGSRRCDPAASADEPRGRVPFTSTNATPCPGAHGRTQGCRRCALSAD